MLFAHAVVKMVHAASDHTGDDGDGAKGHVVDTTLGLECTEIPLAGQNEHELVQKVKSRNQVRVDVHRLVVNHAQR